MDNKRLLMTMIVNEMEWLLGACNCGKLVEELL